jgi:hypothetical protein
VDDLRPRVRVDHAVPQAAGVELVGDAVQAVRVDAHQVGVDQRVGGHLGVAGRDAELLEDRVQPLLDLGGVIAHVVGHAASPPG